MNTLRNICHHVYFLRNPKIRDANTRRQYAFALDNFDAAIGHPALLEDLTDDNVAAMMVLLQARGLAPRTINERRGRINCLWSWLAKRGMVTTWPTTPAMHEPKRLPSAWTIEQVQAILASCDVQGGYIASVPAWLWWNGLHLVLWDTAARINEVLSLRWDMLDQKAGLLVVPAEVRKGQHEDAIYRLHQETAAMLGKVRGIQSPNEELIFPWPYEERYIWQRYKVILKKAGLPHDRKSMFHRMRRTVATQFELLGGDATQLLGHSTRAITTGAYLDPRQIHQPSAIDRLPRINHPR